MSLRTKAEAQTLSNNIKVVTKDEDTFVNGETWSIQGNGTGKKIIDIYERMPESTGNASGKLDNEPSYNHDDKRDKANGNIDSMIPLGGNTINLLASELQVYPFADLVFSGLTAGGVDFSSNVLLIQSNNETDASTAFTDLSNSSHSVDAIGNTQHSTTNPHPNLGSSSILFDGSGDHLVIPDSADWYNSSSDFTWECFIKRTTTGQEGIFSQDPRSGNGNPRQMLVFNSTNQLWFYDSSGGTSLVGSTAISDTNWHHVAVSVESSTMRLFIDGSLDNSGAIAGFTDLSSSMRIGTSWSSSSPSNAEAPFAGQMNGIRFTKGLARYTAGFTVPSALFEAPAISGSVNSITIDSNELLTSSVAMTNSVIGETDYNGVSYTESASSSLINGGDFTVAMEAFIDSTQTNTNAGLCGNASSTTNGFQLLKVPTSDNLIFAARGSAWVNSTISLTGLLDQWIKIVATFDGAGNMQLRVNAIDGPLTATGGANPASTYFNIGTEPTDRTGREFTGKIRNFEYYSGATTDLSAWVPSNTTSLPGTTLEMQSKDGSGTDNTQGISFTITGTPVITPNIVGSGITELVSAINTGPQAATYSASTNDSGLNGTLTISNGLDHLNGNGESVAMTSNGIDNSFATSLSGGNNGKVTIKGPLSSPYIADGSTNASTTDIITNLTSNTSDSANVTVSASSINSASFEAWEAFDGILANTDSWISVAEGTSWLMMEFTTAKVINKYRLAPYPARIPKDWTIEGRIGAGSWVTLDTRTGESPTASVFTSYYTFTNGTAYDDYRIVVTARTLGEGDTAIMELKMIEAEDTGLGSPLDLQGIFPGAVISTLNDTYTIKSIASDNQVITLSETISGGDVAVSAINYTDFYLQSSSVTVLTQGDTLYNGASNHNSTDASLRIITAQTLCAEVYIEPGQTSSNQSSIVGNVGRQSPWGGSIMLFYDGTAGEIKMSKGVSGNAHHSLGVSVSEGVWLKIVGVIKSDYTSEVFVFESSWNSGTGANTTAIAAHTNVFYIGSQPSAIEPFYGNIRNVELYSGAPSNPQGWIPGDTSSLVDTTLVMRSRDANGTNDQSLSFAIGGAPVTTATVLSDHNKVGDNAVLLIQSNTTNGDTVFTDESPVGNVVSDFLSIAHSTTQAKFGTSSIRFSGTQYLEVPSAILQSIGSQDYCFEAWVYMDNLNISNKIYQQNGGTGNDNVILTWEIATGFTHGFYQSGWQIQLQSGLGGYTSNTWYHVAAVRNGSVTTLYVDGIAKDSATAVTFPPYNFALNIGRNGLDLYYLEGYLDEIRITVGDPVYTGNFTPETSSFTTITTPDDYGVTLGVSVSGSSLDDYYTIAPNGGSSVINKSNSADTVSAVFKETNGSTDSYELNNGELFIAVCDSFDTSNKPLNAKVLNRITNDWVTIIAFKNSVHGGTENTWYYWNNSAWLQAEKNNDNGARAFSQALAIHINNRNSSALYIDGHASQITTSEWKNRTNSPRGSQLSFYIGFQSGNAKLWNIFGSFSPYTSNSKINPTDLAIETVSGQKTVNITNNGASLGQIEGRVLG